MPLIKCKTCGALFPQATPNSKCSICGGELTGIISSKKAPITSTPFSQKPSIKSDKIPTFGTESLRAGYFNSSNGRYEEKMTLPASAFSTKLTHNKERIQTETPVVQIPQPIPKVKDEQIPKVIDKQPIVNIPKQQQPQQQKKQEKKQVKEAIDNKKDNKDEGLDSTVIIQNRYKIIRPIKRGGMGAIYEVLDKRLHKNWALKEMMETFDNEQECNEARERFEREATLLASLTHPNLPRVIDFFDENGKFYLVMDYIAGKDLNDILKKQENRRLPINQVFNIIADILGILDYLHHRNPPIIYRDIKPGNIMVRTEDSKTFLIDFGIARSIAPESTDPKTEVGTVGYAPPEQYTGNPMPCSDLYALGATMHELISGVSPKIPFQFQSLKEIIPTISNEVNHIVLKALELDYHKRWQNAEEMLEAVKNVINTSDYYVNSSNSKANIIPAIDPILKDLPVKEVPKKQELVQIQQDITTPKNPEFAQVQQDLITPKNQEFTQVQQDLTIPKNQENVEKKSELIDIPELPKLKDQDLKPLANVPKINANNQVFELHNSQSSAINQFISKTQSNLRIDLSKRFKSSVGMDVPIFDQGNVLSKLADIKQPKMDFPMPKIDVQSQNPITNINQVQEQKNQEQNNNELRSIFSENKEPEEKVNIQAPYIPEKKSNNKQEPIKEDKTAENEAKVGIMEYCRKFKDPFIKTENDCFISDFQFNPQKATICLTDRNGTIQIKSLNDLRTLATVRTGFSGISTFDFSSNGSYFSYNSQKNECTVMNSRSLSIIAKFSLKDCNIIKVLLHPSEPFVIIGCDDGTVVKCNYSTQEKTIFRYNKLPITSMAINIDGKYLYTGHTNGTIHLWNIEENSITAKYKMHTGKVNDLSVAQNNKLLVSCSEDGSIILWRSEELSYMKKLYDKQAGAIYSVNYAINKPYIYTVSQDCSIRIWDLMTGTVNMQAYKNDTRITKIRIKSYTDNTYIAASTDNAIFLWKKEF